MLIHRMHWNMITPDEWPVVHFEPKEMADRRTGEIMVDLDFMRWLDTVRRRFNRPMVVSSGYRTSEHQEAITGRKTGAHVDGQAADILTPTNGLAHSLVELAMEEGAFGIGVDLRPSVGHGSWYVHLDMWVRRAGHEHVMWGYG